MPLRGWPIARVVSGELALTSAYAPLDGICVVRPGSEERRNSSLQPNEMGASAAAGLAPSMELPVHSQYRP